MEATKEQVGLLDKILPPALADAGLEDCALPPNLNRSISQSRQRREVSRSLDFRTRGGRRLCSRSDSGSFDTIIIGGDNERDTGPCLAGKGNVKLTESEKAGDLVVAGEGGEGRSCVDGLKDLDVEGIESSGEKKYQSEEDEDEEMKPILVEGFV